MVFCMIGYTTGAWPFMAGFGMNLVAAGGAAAGIGAKDKKWAIAGAGAAAIAVGVYLVKANGVPAADTAAAAPSS